MKPKSDSMNEPPPDGIPSAVRNDHAVYTQSASDSVHSPTATTHDTTEIAAVGGSSGTAPNDKVSGGSDGMDFSVIYLFVSGSEHGLNGLPQTR